MVGGNAFAKTICSICYEDLKPIVEDLQSISICGHVFHELCIQQWFEYCSNGKKKNCPVCKQTCSESNANRLYFQSVGDPNDQCLSQRPRDVEENPEELRREVKRLEGKVSGLTSAFENQQKDLKELNEELSISKNRLKVEVASKNEALKQKATIQQLLQLKSEELDLSTLECMRLQERNMALAKELAALKLISDLNLEEDGILKLASLGSEANSKETVDVLKKSLVIRNKSYKELMAKCNVLGRGEARSLSRLNKSKEKIKRLKTRVKELEIAAEVKDNEVLRALKKSKKDAGKLDIQFDKDQNSSSPHVVEDQMKRPVLSKINLDKVESTFNRLCSSEPMEKFTIFKNIYDSRTGVPEMRTCTSLNVEASENFTSINGKPQRNNALDTNNKGEEHLKSKGDGPSVAMDASKDDIASAPHAAMDDDDDGDDVVLLDEIMSGQPLIHIRKNNLEVPVARPGDVCFSGGLLGPDGSNWHLGKWCKRALAKGSTTPSTGIQRSSTSSSDLIAVGADGRGGRIKVLKSSNQPSLEINGASTLVKRCKYGSKTSSLQSQGCMQIEHFFGKAAGP